VTFSAGTVIRSYFGSRGGELEVGSMPIGAVIATVGTPVFVYDEAVLEKKWRLLRDAYPPAFQVCYSVKANPNPHLIRFFLRQGCGLEIASAGEFHASESAGCAPERMLFAGPGKTEQELELVLGRGIGEIHVESETEVGRIAAICRRLGVRGRVAVRVNPSEAAQGGAMQMGGKSAPFGVDEEQLGALVDRILEDRALEFQGLHLFVGTQILDASILMRQYRKGVEIASSVARRAAVPIRTLDFGGGLGIPYFDGEDELDMAGLRRELETLVAEVRGDGVLEGTRFIVEPGRYLVGEAGIYVTRVTDVKVSRGKKYLVMDGGMNHHLAASGNLGRVIRRNFPVGLINRIADETLEPVDVVGPLCTPLDVLARDVALPSPRVGDLLGVFQSGAYARAASPLGFLSHPTPPEVLVGGGKVTLIRRRGTHQDWLQDVPPMTGNGP